MSGIGGIGSGRGYDPADSGAQKSAATPAAGAPVVRGTAPDPRRMGGAGTVQVSADYQRAAALLDAMHKEPADKLEKTLAAAKKESPVAYRDALREFFDQHMRDASKIKLHNMAMDANNDGSLTFGEAYSTMRDMGFTRLRSFLLSGLTAFALAPQTSDKFTTKLNVANSDKTERKFFLTGFDTKEQLEGRLDELMTEDLDKDGSLTLADVHRLVDKRTAKMESKLGAKAINYLNKGEWQALFALMEGQRMTRDELRDFYEGSLFFSFLEPDNLAKKLVEYRKP